MHASVHGVAEKARELFSQAQDKFNDGESEAAIDLLTQSIAVNPTRAQSFVLRARAHLKLGHPRAAIQECSVALSINPDSGMRNV